MIRTGKLFHDDRTLTTVQDGERLLLADWDSRYGAQPTSGWNKSSTERDMLRLREAGFLAEVVQRKPEWPDTWVVQILGIA